MSVVSGRPLSHFGHAVPEAAHRFPSSVPRRGTVARSRMWPSGMAFDKVRIRFRKDGDLRLVSHHDLMRCFERMLRRAALPMRNTSGFHPKPRLVFALSLPLGVIGRDEVAELELEQDFNLADIHYR